MKLQHVKREVMIVDSADFEQFVSEVYDIAYDFVENEEASNDSAYEFMPTGKLLDSDYEKARVEKILNGDDVICSARTILNMLVRDGHIEAGYYLISVSW